MAKYIGFGSKLQWSVNGASYADIGQITSIDGPGLARPEVDVTTMDSTAKEYLAGPKDGGNVSISVVWDSTALAHSFFTQGTGGSINNASHNTGAFWRIEHSGSSGIAIILYGACVGFTPTFASEDAVTAQIELLCTVASTITLPT